MNWEAVMDVQLDLWKWWQSPEGQRYGHGFAESMARVGDVTRRGEGEGEVPLAVAETRKVYHADPVSVTEDVMTLVEAAYPSFEIEPLRGSDLLTPHGFVLLPRPYTMRDVNGKQMAMRGIAWAPAVTKDADGNDKHGIDISFYSYVYDAEDDFNADLIRTYKEARERGSTTARLFPYSMSHITNWWFGDTWADMEGGLQVDGDERRKNGVEGVRTTFQFFQAFMRIAQQTITRSEKRPPPKGAKKRAKREDFDDDPFVTIITLRRHESTGEGSGEPANYSHRFIVRGHWRNQWYPSLNEHRQKWVGGYVKGDPSLELIIKPTRAFEVVR